MTQTLKLPKKVVKANVKDDVDVEYALAEEGYSQDLYLDFIAYSNENNYKPINKNKKFDTAKRAKSRLIGKVALFAKNEKLAA